MLRKATPEDSEAIGRIRVAAWRAAYREFLPKSFLDGLDPLEKMAELRNRLVSQSPEFNVSVAEVDEQVVGFSIVGKPRYESEAGTIELWALNVSPDYWRRGVGSCLVTEAAAYARQEQFGAIGLWCIENNTPAQKAYEKLGFIQTGIKRSTSGLTGSILHEVQYIIML